MTDRNVEILRAQVALGEVIEAGWLIEEAIEDPSRRLNLGSGANQYWASRLGVEFLNRRRQQIARIDTPYRVHRISGLLNDFAAEFAAAAELIDGQELHASARDAADWAIQLRHRKRSVHEVYADLKVVLGELRQEQAKLTLERMRQGPANGV